MSDDDDEFADLLDCYSSAKTVQSFKNQFNKLKKSMPEPVLPLTEEKAPVATEICIEKNDNEDLETIIEDAHIETPTPFDLLSPSPEKTDRDTRSLIDECIITEEISPPHRYKTRSSGRLRQTQINFIPKKRPTRQTSKSKNVSIVTLAEDEETANATNSSLIEDNYNFETNVKVFWKSTNVVKIPVRRMQKLSVVFEHFMKQEDLPMDRIMLTFRNKPVKPTDTPDSLGLDILDFIEGGVVNSGIRTSSDTPEVVKERGFYIKFQDVNKKTIRVSAKRVDKMQIILLRYAEQVEKPVNSFKFFFDGTLIKSSDSPELLEMENEDIIDVVS